MVVKGLTTKKWRECQFFGVEVILYPCREITCITKNGVNASFSELEYIVDKWVISVI
jgi:hypothetical protein